MNTKTQFAIVLVVSVIGAVVIWSLFSPAAHDANPANAITTSWKTSPLPDENGIPQVELTLILSGAIEQEVPLGKFAGEPIPQGIENSEEPLLWQSSWTGSENAVYVQQKDSQHLEVISTLLDDAEQSEELTVIQIPADTFLKPEEAI